MSNEGLFSKNYEFIAIATDKMQGGDELMDELKKDRNGGMPWMVILDGDGQELTTSNDAEGNNIGCPVKPFEIEHFVAMIKKSSDTSEKDLAAISDAMTANAEKINNR